MAQKISTHLLLSGFEARKPANQKGFDEIFEYCHLIYGEKLKFLTKLNLYCQTKAETGRKEQGKLAAPFLVNIWFNCFFCFVYVWRANNFVSLIQVTSNLSIENRLYP